MHLRGTVFSEKTLARKKTNFVKYLTCYFLQLANSITLTRTCALLLAVWNVGNCRKLRNK
jgi:hypothetical protein